MVHESTFYTYNSYSHILTLHLIIGCIWSFKIYFTINFICAVLILFWTKGSEVISKCGLFKYYFAALIVCLSTSLSFAPNPFLSVSVYCINDFNCCAVTIALIWATSPNGVVMNDDNILGSLRIFWLRAMGSFGFLSSPYPCANTHLTPMVHAPVVCQCLQRVVLYFWLNAGFILL
jgi:hypothetical protein